ncbi:MAG TPA: hypothetical protein VGF59_25300 [Bryobacteraceae bacterium]
MKVYRTAVLVVGAVAAAGVASAQIYPPGGGYPYPGRRLPTSGPGIPIPGRSGKQQKDSKTASQPLPNFRGHLKQMDNKSITLELDDFRVLEFRRTDKTKFFKNGDELKTPNFAAGDQISVEGSEDPNGDMTAVNVYWEKAASKSTETKDGVVDTWADDVKPPAVEHKPPAAKPDADDPGPPKLQRGRVADPSREKSKGVPDAPQSAANAPPPPAPAVRTPDAHSEPPHTAASDEDVLPTVLNQHLDPLIRKASEAALEFTEGLPAYVCQEMMARFQSSSKPANWQPIDVVSANLVYENGKEDYRDIAINGKPLKKGSKMKDTEGAWSTGEFGTLLIDLFSPATAADFRPHGTSRIAGVNAKIYDFSVERERSHWSITMGAQTYEPPYRGSVWIDPQTARVLRIEMQAHGFPESFPSDHVEGAVDYEYVRLGDMKQYLLPVHSENLMCQRGSNLCSKLTIDFRNYHKYTGESSVTFGDTVKK